MNVEYVIPESKLFPISKPEDVKTAYDAYHLFEDEIDYQFFCFRLIGAAKKLGSDFVEKLPTKLKKFCGAARENRPESPQPYHKTGKKKQNRFVRKDRDYEDRD